MLAIAGGAFAVSFGSFHVYCSMNVNCGDFAGLIPLWIGGLVGAIAGGFMSHRSLGVSKPSLVAAVAILLVAGLLFWFDPLHLFRPGPDGGLSINAPGARP